MMGGSANWRKRSERISAQVLCSANATFSGSIAVDDIVETTYFPHPVWRTPTMLLYNNNNCLPWLDFSESFDTIDTNKTLEVKKRLEEKSTSGFPYANQLTLIDYNNLEVRTVNVWSWGCVSFSSLSVTEVHKFLLELTKMCTDLGLDISQDPAMLNHETIYSHHTDITHGLKSALEFFGEQGRDVAKLLVILLDADDAECTEANLDERFKDLGVTCHYCRCFPKVSSELRKKCLMDAAAAITNKVLKFASSISSADTDEETEEDFSQVDLPWAVNNPNRLLGDQNGIRDEEIFKGTPSNNLILHVENNFNKKRKCDHPDNLQEAEPTSEGQPPVISEVCHDSLGEMLEDDGSEGLPADMSIDSSLSGKNGIHDEENLVATSQNILKKRKSDDTDDLQEIEQTREEKTPVTSEVQKIKVVNWACACFAPLSEDVIRKFCRKLRKRCMDIGMEFSLFPRVLLNENPACSGDIENILFDAVPVDLIVILPQVRDFHGKIEEACTYVGSACQYFWPMSAIEPRKLCLQKAAYEITTKIAGRQAGCWLEPCARNAIPSVSKPTIIFGAAVTTSFTLLQSFSSVVASMDWPGVSRYHSVVTQLPIRRFTIEFGAVRYLLEAFLKETKQHAAKIIFFRNAIESQLSEDIFRDDITVVTKACESLCKGYRPPITYMVVSTDQRSNVMCDVTKKSNSPGTVEVGLDPVKFEFSCDHKGIEATGTRAHYHVIHNENNFTRDVLESICLNLSTPYDRWSYPDMSTVPPVYYAEMDARIKEMEEESEHRMLYLGDCWD